MKREFIVAGLLIMLCTFLCAIGWAGSDVKVNQDADLSVQNEPSIVINRHYISDPLNVVVAYNDIGKSLGVSWSPDGGASWTDVQLPLVYSFGTGDPSVAADLNGNVYACFLSYDAQPTFYGKSGIFVSKSTDGGRNWGTPYPVDNQIYLGTGTPVPFTDKCFVTVDTNSASPYVNNVYVAWQRDNTDGAHSDIYFARSNNGGVSYTTPIKINDNALGSGFCEGAFPFVGADGDVYVAWYNAYYQGHEPGSLYVDKSTNGGLTFGTDVKVADFDAPPKYTFSNTGFRAKSFPSAAGDPNSAEDLYITYIADPDGYFDKRLDNGKQPGVPGTAPSDWPVIHREGNNVYVAWRDYRNGATDIYFNRSTDNGQTWQYPDIGRLDNGDAAGANTSWMQKLSSSGNYVYCLWEDYRIGGGAHIFFNRSTDYGQTWGADMVIDGGGAYNGSTPVIACSGSYVYAVWSDTRNLMTDIYFNVSNNYGQTWGTAQRIDTGESPGLNHSVQPRIACTGNNVYVMWLDYRTGTTQVFFNYSNNNGTTWQGSSTQLCAGTGYNCYIPTRGGIKCSGNYVYTCWTDDRGVTFVNDVYFKSSSNSGVSWNMEVPLNTPGGNCNEPSLDIQGNNVYVAWEDDRVLPGTYNNDIYFTASTNNGATWQTDQNLDHLPGIRDIMVEIKSEGNYVYATWLDSRNYGMGMGDVYFNRSANNGTTWGTETKINLGSQSIGMQNSYPFISAGNGFVNIVWHDPRAFGLPNIYTNYSSDNGASWLNGMDEADVYCVASHDGGANWGTPVTVNDDGTTYAQVLPWVAVKDNGMVDITYYNFRFAPMDLRFPGAELRFTASTNQAVSFLPSQAIQDTVVTPMTNWVGEYNGMAVDGNLLYTVFTDLEQSGNSDIYLDITENPIIGGCQGECGDANFDTKVNVSDAVYIINYVFVGGTEPKPVLACGDANDDAKVNVSDAVYIINFVFTGGTQPDDCSPGSVNWYNGDCCIFTP